MHQAGERQAGKPRGRRVGTGAEHDRRLEPHNHTGCYRAGEVFKVLGQDVAGNEIGDQGAAELARGLREDREIELLSLHSNSIGDRGAAALQLRLVDQDQRLRREHRRARLAQAVLR